MGEAPSLEWGPFSKGETEGLLLLSVLHPSPPTPSYSSQKSVTVSVTSTKSLPVFLGDAAGL